MRRYFTLAAAAGLAVALALTGCSGSAVSQSGGGASSSAAGGEIVIGALHPATGAYAADGQQMNNGAQMAVNAVNAAGGIKTLGGAKLKLATADTKGEPETGSSEATRLIQSGAVALIGTYQSAVSTNVAAVAERNKVPFVMDVSNADDILTKGYTYSFRLQPNASTMGSLGFDALQNIAGDAHKPVKQVAFLYENGAFGSSTLASFKSKAKAVGVKLDPVIGYDAASVSDMTTQIQQVSASGADVLAVAGYYRDGVLVAQAVNTVKPKLNAVFGVANGAFDQPQFVKDAPNGGDGYFNANYAIDRSNPDALALAKDYQAKYGETMRTSAAESYDALKLVADAIDRAQSKDPAKVRDAIASTSYKPMVANKGPVHFNDKGENTNAGLIATQILDAKIQQVYPAAGAETKPVYPAPISK
jgi:branched-chain amino acid transport system substrate-binding protein